MSTLQGKENISHCH